MWRWTLLLSVLAMPRTTAAQEAGAAWSAPPGCPDAKQVASSAEAHPAAAAALDEGRARVRIDRDPTGALRARLTLSNGETPAEVRELRAADCEALTHGVLLVLDLAADGTQARDDFDEGGGGEEMDQDIPAPPPTTPPPAPAPPRAPLASRPASTEKPASPPPPRPRPVLRLGALGLLQVDRGSLPSATGAISAGGVLWRGLLWIDLRGSYYFPDRVRVQGFEASGADFDLVTAQLRTCVLTRRATPGAASVRLGGCLGAELGAARGTSEGLEPARSGRGLFAALPLAALATFGPFRDLLPFAQLAFGPVLKAPIFRVAGEPVHHAQGWLVRAGLGLAWVPSVGPRAGR